MDSTKMPIASGGLGRSRPGAFGMGALIGTLGGLIGLGGAEFRLPLLISLFGFRGLEAVILNKTTSLVVVGTALPFRARSVPFGEIGAHRPIIVNLLCGSLFGAWVGAEWATRLKSETLLQSDRRLTRDYCHRFAVCARHCRRFAASRWLDAV
jgi:Sulfite exporter TauE/SafE